MGPVFDDLVQLLGRSPTVAEVADRLGVGEEDVLECLEAGSAFRTVPLSVLAWRDRDEQADDEPAVLAVDDTNPALVDERDRLRTLLSVLDPRERAVVYLRFFEGLTQSEIATRIGVSQMHVSRLLQRSIADLREAAGPGHASEEASSESLDRLGMPPAALSQPPRALVPPGERARLQGTDFEAPRPLAVPSVGRAHA